jgi:hypothetical protein
MTRYFNATYIVALHFFVVWCDNVTAFQGPSNVFYIYRTKNRGVTKTTKRKIPVPNPESQGMHFMSMGDETIGVSPNDISTLLSSSSSSSLSSSSSSPSSVSIDQLIDTDVVIFSFAANDDSDTNDKKLLLAAMQEDGVLSPLSAWTIEPAFGTSMEFLVDDADRFSLVNAMDKIRIHYILSESELSYGSRQCARGVHNPHGEESELLYYVEQEVIDKFQIRVVLKPELEILW